MLLEYAATELQGELWNQVWRILDLPLNMSSNSTESLFSAARATQLFSLLQTTKFLICYIVIPIAVADAKDPLQPNPIADNVNI